MATFTSVTSGNWNDGATWGKTSPGVKGTDWPGNVGDVVNIGTTANQSHVVTYNVSETNELGQITIGATSGTGVSRLEFATNLNTKLTLGPQDILINTTGEVRGGSSGAILPKQYTAELVWNTTADNTKGINLASGGKLTIYGDPDYFGADYDTILVSQAVIPAATNAVTITVAGDFATKWLAGHELLVHKGGTYASQINDCCRLAITSLSANGSNTDLACTVTERPGSSLTCLAGADVFNVSRNVLLYKLGYNANLGQYNTTRPRMANANVTGTNNIKIHDAVAAGWYAFPTGIGVDFNGVVRNGNWPFSNTYQAVIDGISFSNNYGYYNVFNSLVAGKCVCCTSGVPGCANTIFSSDFIAIGIGSQPVWGYRNTYTGSIYSCYGVNYQAVDCKVIGGSIGYDRNGYEKANGAYGFAFANYSWLTLCNVKMNTPPSFYGSGRNLAICQGRMGFEHYGRVANAHYVADNWGDIYKVAADGSGDNPSQRSGGGADVQEVIPQSNCAASSYLEIFNVRLWAAAGVNKTYRFYVQTDFAALLTAALKLYGEYLDQGSGGHLATVSSTQDIATRANASDWSQYVEVTINSAQDGYVNLYLGLMGYEAGKKVWVDPKPEGVAMTPRWSYGEVVLEPITASGGGSVSPTNLGLVPLGIKQVAI